jgi:integrase
MGEKINDRLVEKLALPKAGWEITWDAEVPGFGCRVTAGGARSFVLRYRTRSRRGRLHTIGPAGSGGWKTSTAREHAKNLKARIRSEAGYDPIGELQAERDAPTVDDLAKRFLKEHAAKKRPVTREGYRRAFEKYILPSLRHRKVADVHYTDIDTLHDKITEEGGPYIANRIVAVLSKAFNLAIRWRWCTVNPCKGVERNVEQKRKRYLDGDEIARLTEALSNHSDQKAASVIRMLLLTGARKGEVLSARWEQFDLTAGTWTKLSSETKQARDHTVPISAPVRQLLADIRAAAKKKKKDSPFVFPGRAGTHLKDIKEDWAALCASAGIVKARIHDLRHTFASALVSGGKSLELVGALLGHSQIQTTLRYSHLYLDKQREAAETAASIIAPNGQGAQVIKHPKVS